MHYLKPDDTHATGAPPAAAWVWPLFLLTALTWLLFGVISLARIGPSTGAWIVAALMFADAGLLLLAGWGVRRRSRGFYFLALALLAVNIILTFTDQFGLLDFIYLVLAAALLLLLILLRDYYA